MFDQNNSMVVFGALLVKAVLEEVGICETVRGFLDPLYSEGEKMCLCDSSGVSVVTVEYSGSIECIVCAADA